VTLRAVLFDYGGTLDGEASHWLDRFVNLYREAGVETPFERLKEAFYAADETCYATPRIADAGIAELMDFHVRVQLDRLGQGDAGLHRSLVDRFVADSQASLAANRRILERLQPAFRLGVVSNFYGNVGRILDEAGFGTLLTVVADSHRVGWSKPDPSIYRWAVAQLGVSAAEVMHVGDSYARDVLPAREAGLRTAWLRGGRAIERNGPPPDLTLDSLDELLVHLDAF
jgi:putative hydrolase of the HAD superfamily